MVEVRVGLRKNIATERWRKGHICESFVQSLIERNKWTHCLHNFNAWDKVIKKWKIDRQKIVDKLFLVTLTSFQHEKVLALPNNEIALWDEQWEIELLLYYWLNFKQYWKTIPFLMEKISSSMYFHLQG